MTLPLSESQSAAKLLNEDAPTMCDAREAQDVDVRDVDPFVENVDSGDNWNITLAECHESKLSISTIQAGMDCLNVLPLGDLVK
ncbi:hypothetical protein AFM16_26110 [Streptomyces antibioticus]|uniref:Uncharacterized protein n=1 Tax=Streptomyces antibioticus TaxID=1890 RepID=A0ABX3LFY7_STRAT|nr:hypothetical protein AFM16_26110 [Streptomyces antibioticus]